LTLMVLAKLAGEQSLRGGVSGNAKLALSAF
jgi:hypothetical protein